MKAKKNKMYQDILKFWTNSGFCFKVCLKCLMVQKIDKDDQPKCKKCGEALTKNKNELIGDKP